MTPAKLILTTFYMKIMSPTMTTRPENHPASSLPSPIMGRPIIRIRLLQPLLLCSPALARPLRTATDRALRPKTGCALNGKSTKPSLEMSISRLAIGGGYNKEVRRSVSKSTSSSSMMARVSSRLWAAREKRVSEPSKHLWIAKARWNVLLVIWSGFLFNGVLANSEVLLFPKSELFLKFRYLSKLYFGGSYDDWMFKHRCVKLFIVPTLSWPAKLLCNTLHQRT